MIETVINYENQIKTLQTEIDALRTKTFELEEEETRLREMKKKAKEQKLRELQLGICSMYHSDSTNSQLPPAYYPIAELRYFFFSYYWERKGNAGREFILQRLCPQHFPEK